MGINSSYYDFYNIYQGLSEQFNCIMVDLLGSGSSEQPLNFERTLENVSEEFIDFINHLGLNSIYICCHSFSGIYILNSINSGQINPKINGLIGIDPSSSVIMKEYLSELSSNYDEAMNSKSAVVKLNGHHFLHWQHPELMSNFITDFVKSDLDNYK